MCYTTAEIHLWGKKYKLNLYTLRFWLSCRLLCILCHLLTLYLAPFALMNWWFSQFISFLYWFEVKPLISKWYLISILKLNQPFCPFGKTIIFNALYFISSQIVILLPLPILCCLCLGQSYSFITLFAYQSLVELRVSVSRLFPKPVPYSRLPKPGILEMGKYQRLPYSQT